MTESMVEVNGIDICHETFGDPGARPLLLIMGLGGPMNWWDDEFCEGLAGVGFHIIRYDNRDCGRSTRMQGRISPVQAYLRRSSPYSLTDLADDAAGLLDRLGLPSAHVVGTSMGGMIAQALAIGHPAKVRSLTSIMSSTGGRFVGRPSPRAVAALLSPPPRDRDRYVDYLLRTLRVIGSPGFPFETDRMRERAERTFDRGLNPGGTARQLAAILAARDRSAGLRRLTVPALVFHGAADPLVHVSGGRATARAIPGAELEVVPGMGHDLPRPVWPSLFARIRKLAERAEAAR